MNPEKKLKLILASLKDKQIIKFLQILLSNFQADFRKNIRQISFNCYESVCEFKNKVVSGYGKNSNEAYVNSVRTLVELLADDPKMHQPMKQSINEIHDKNPANYESQKKILTLDKTFKNSSKNSLNVSTKIPQKKPTLKEQIFQYLNLDNLKISNPNISQKPKPHDKYMNKSTNEKDENEEILEDLLRKNRELQAKLTTAKQENEKLKSQLQRKSRQSNTKSKSNLVKQIQEPLKTKTNEFLNLSHDCKLLQKQRMRTTSVESSCQNQTQKYHIPRPPTSNASVAPKQKKIPVPKLNLQVLPNYHGKSNKSLNQSLMDVYQKNHK